MRRSYPWLPWLVIALTFSSPSQGQTYEETQAIFKDKLHGDVYHPEVRRLLNQSQAIQVGVAFQLMSIVELNDVSQSFSCNGFVYFFWQDERVVWNPGSYGGQYVVHPKPVDKRRPRVALMNTLGERDLFKDDHSRLAIYYDRRATWIPGTLFDASCHLDLTNYQFDQQTCFLHLRLAALYYSSPELQFYSPFTKVQTLFFTSNGEWDLADSSVETFNQNITIEMLPTVQFTFHLKRRPAFFLLNIVMPIVLLSFLNILVFIIPVKCGEKVSYGITVLLALALFMSIVSGMLPRTADPMPTVLIYLFIIFILSVLTVIDSIIIVYVHHRNMMEPNVQQQPDVREPSGNKVVPLDARIITHDTVQNTRAPKLPADEDPMPYDTKSDNPAHYDVTVAKSRTLRGRVKCLELTSFVVFSLIWLAVTLGFLLHISATVDLHRAASRVTG